MKLFIFLSIFYTNLILYKVSAATEVESAAIITVARGRVSVVPFSPGASLVERDFASTNASAQAMLASKKTQWGHTPKYKKFSKNALVRIHDVLYSLATEPICAGSSVDNYESFFSFSEECLDHYEEVEKKEGSILGGALIIRSIYKRKIKLLENDLNEMAMYFVTSSEGQSHFIRHLNDLYEDKLEALKKADQEYDLYEKLIQLIQCGLDAAHQQFNNAEKKLTETEYKCSNFPDIDNSRSLFLEKIESLQEERINKKIERYNERQKALSDFNSHEYNLRRKIIQRQDRLLKVIETQFKEQFKKIAEDCCILVTLPERHPHRLLNAAQDKFISGFASDLSLSEGRLESETESSKGRQPKTIDRKPLTEKQRALKIKKKRSDMLRRL